MRSDHADQQRSQAELRAGELVLDIGAGQGALTRHLVDAGARVLAVELQPARAQRLRERFAEAPITVIQTDALSPRWLGWVVARRLGPYREGLSTPGLAALQFWRCQTGHRRKRFRLSSWSLLPVRIQ